MPEKPFDGSGSARREAGQLPQLPRGSDGPGGSWRSRDLAAAPLSSSQLSMCARAREHVLAALQLRPADGGLHFLLGRVLLAERSLDAASDAFDQAQALGVDRRQVAPLRAAGPNSPVLLRPRLWHETRGARFIQSLDTGRGARVPPGGTAAGCQLLYTCRTWRPPGTR